MAIVPLNCGVSYKDVSRDECQKSIKEAQVLLLAPNGFKLTKDDWLDEALIKGYIADRKLRPIHVINLVENTSAGDVTEEVNGVESIVKHGEGRFKYQIAGITQCSYGDLKSLEQRSGSSFSAFIIDKADEIGGIFDQSGDLYPIALNSFTVSQPPIVADGTTIPKYEATIRFDFEKLSFSPFGYTFTGLMWNIVDGLIDVDFTDAVLNGSDVTVNIHTSCGGSPVSGLDAGDFADIGGQAVSSVAEGDIGTWTLTLGSAPASGTHSIELKNPANQTTKIYVTGTAGEITV